MTLQLFPMLKKAPPPLYVPAGDHSRDSPGPLHFSATPRDSRSESDLARGGHTAIKIDLDPIQEH